MKSSMLTVLAEQKKVFASICKGTGGYLLKETPPANLLEAIRASAPRWRANLAHKVIKVSPQTGPPEKSDQQLSPQAARLLKLLAEGYSYSRAA